MQLITFVTVTFSLWIMSSMAVPVLSKDPELSRSIRSFSYTPHLSRDNQARSNTVGQFGAQQLPEEKIVHHQSLNQPQNQVGVSRKRRMVDAALGTLKDTLLGFAGGGFTTGLMVVSTIITGGNPFVRTWYVTLLGFNRDLLTYTTFYRNRPMVQPIPAPLIAVTPMDGGVKQLNDASQFSDQEAGPQP
ncbi:hypothetical protein FRC03_002059 [Tulasnella sp. 419]|nr:hypothetical protein FRC03_002059 [Tulasnella sp. 419]